MIQIIVTIDEDPTIDTEGVGEITLTPEQAASAIARTIRRAFNWSRVEADVKWEH
jgi:hypothetical protein